MFPQVSVILSTIGLMPPRSLLILVGYSLTILWCGRYASYWNAFLFSFNIYHNLCWKLLLDEPIKFIDLCLFWMQFCLLLFNNWLKRLQDDEIPQQMNDATSQTGFVWIFTSCLLIFQPDSPNVWWRGLLIKKKMFFETKTQKTKNHTL